MRAYGLRMPTRRRPSPAVALMLGSLGAWGCDPAQADIGKPCEQKSDCAGALICDEHDGRGSCQEAHTHGEDEVVAVRWIEVAASDYKLDLDPDFDPEVTEYRAQADGPGIVVYADVILTGDAEGVTVNGEPAELIGFRTWRSPESAELAAPTSITVEVLALEGAEVREPLYDIDVTAAPP